MSPGYRGDPLGLSAAWGLACRAAGDLVPMRLGRVGIIGAAVSFAQSERGQRMIREARQKYDTPENRAKAKDTLSGLRGRPRR